MARPVMRMLSVMQMKVRNFRVTFGVLVKSTIDAWNG